MNQEKYVVYKRVSTDKQGRSGLGLEAQQTLVEPYMSRVIATYTEVESGKDDRRPQLAAALAHCKREGAAILIAKIDRLSRNAAFLFTLRDSGVEIVAADMPSAGTLEFGIRAVFAQHEREEISRRTKAALAEAKRRGVKLGCPDPRRNGAKTAAARRAKTDAVAGRVMPIIMSLRDGGKSYAAIAANLNTARIPSSMGGEWHATSVRNLLKRETA